MTLVVSLLPRGHQGSGGGRKEGERGGWRGKEVGRKEEIGIVGRTEERVIEGRMEGLEGVGEMERREGMRRMEGRGAGGRTKWSVDVVGLGSDEE